MRATALRVLLVPAKAVESEDGWAAPEGWRIVDSNKVINSYRVTLAKS